MSSTVAATGVVSLTRHHLELHAEPRGGRFGLLAQPGDVAGSGDQDAEQQPSPQHDLLDVEDLHTEPG